jgi:dienelactone hydrolase/WD40 repeat protein
MQFKLATWIPFSFGLLSAAMLLPWPDAAGAQQAASGNLSASDLASPDAGVELTLPRYLQSRSARFIDWLADGSMLVATRFGETEQVHRVRSPLSMREQLSFEPAGVMAAAAEPEHSDAFVFLSPRAGGQSAALLLQRLGGQAAVPLTDGTFRDGSALWAHDGKRIAFSSNRGAGSAERTGHEREIELLDTTVAAPALRLMAGGTGYRWRIFDWSLDDQRLLLGRETLSAETEANGGVAGDPELFVADVGNTELTPLVLPHKAASKAPAPAPTALRSRAARFAPDGRGILLLATGESAAGAGAAGADFWQLRYLDPVGGDTRVLSSESERDVDLFDESPDGHYLAYTINDGGTSRLALLDQQRKLDLNLGALPPGVISSLQFDPTGKRLALTLESARSPRDVYVLEPETQTLTRWTQSELGPIDPASLVTPVLVRFPTWDRIDGQARMLSAFVYRSGAAGSGTPPATTPPAPRPVLILLRSGGGSQFRPGFEPLVQYLVNELGFVVLAPNVRGSAGYGRSFGDLAQGALRDDAARDVGSLLVWIGLQHELDYNRIMVMGEGYGSTLALSCLAQYGDRLRGAIVAFPPHTGALSNLASIRRPVLLVHGRSNPDAPGYETEQLAARLRANGAPVQYLGAADEAGEFLRKSNRDAYYAAAANFLAQLLR